jgi:hypothetical protein
MLSLEMLFEDFLAGCGLKRTALHGAGVQPGFRNTALFFSLKVKALDKFFEENLGV